MKPLHWIILLILITGCDDRATQIAREAADRQAQQNTTMAALQEEVAQGSRRLVAHDAEARKDFVGVHHDLQAERTRLDSSWEALEVERAQIARNHRTESLLVPAIQTVSGMTLVVVLLGFCWYVLSRLQSDNSVGAELNALLVKELLASGEPDSPPITTRPAIPDSAADPLRLR